MLIALISLLVIMAAGVGIYVYSGSYPVGADVPHTGVVFSVLTTVRNRGITTGARGIHPPADLNDARRLSDGAGQYATMCASCHLAPGYEDGPTWEGLYPHPPRLAHATDLKPAEVFWTIKHGVKFSGMPAWGKSHSDDEIWSITAFVLDLPRLTPRQYRDIVSRAPPDSDMLMMPMPGSRPAGDGSPGARATMPMPE